ncbi:hypothetical protein RV07_GL001001 [Enterococcus malodoratus]|nr:hypothetical protein RV07_GL001001 [Enterococcus malodoratus]
MQAVLAEEMQADKKYFSVSIQDVEADDWKDSVEDKIESENLFISAEF